MRRVGRHLIIIDREPPMRVDARIYAGADVEVEPAAVDQLVDACALPGIKVALATPDIHPGYGAPIGAVLGMEDSVIPSAVGYDINCGMCLMCAPVLADGLPLADIVRAIRSAVPLGEGRQNIEFKGPDLHAILSRGLDGFIKVASNREFSREHPEIADGLDLDIEKYSLERVEDRGSMPGNPEALPPKAVERGRDQFGTLGGGNHFIEIQCVTDIYDEQLATQWGIFKGQATIMIHSGSRGLGHETGGHFMRLSREYDERNNLDYPGRDLAWLPSSSAEGIAYLGAMNSAANFAFVNRHLMALLVIRAFRNTTGVYLRHVYDVAHNIAKREKHSGADLFVHRKGATRAFTAERMHGTPYEKTGHPVLIPGSMGTSSYLLVGINGNEQTLASVNHGAGRSMSRTAASGRNRHGRARGTGLIDRSEFEESMKGIILSAEDRRSVMEEAPAAYKNIDAVIETVTGAGLARRVARMRPLAVLKG